MEERNKLRDQIEKLYASRDTMTRENNDLNEISKCALEENFLVSSYRAQVAENQTERLL